MADDTTTPKSHILPIRVYAASLTAHTPIWDEQGEVVTAWKFDGKAAWLVAVNDTHAGALALGMCKEAFPLAVKHRVGIALFEPDKLVQMMAHIYGDDMEAPEHMPLGPTEPAEETTPTDDAEEAESERS